MMKTPAILSIIVPVYRAQDTLDKLYSRIKETLDPLNLSFELILVEDCGGDRSWEIIETIARQDARVKGLKLSRNYGQHYAITAGLDYAMGDWVIVMDCDLQDQPEEIIKLYNKANEGFDIVLARRYQRKDKFFKKLFSALFYRALGYLTGVKQDGSVANFGIYNKKTINAIKRMREPIRYFPSMIKWVGFNVAKVNVEHDYRIDGKSNYNIKKLMKLALDIILAYSDKPIIVLIKFGLLVSFVSFIIAIYVLLKWIHGDIYVLGYTSIIVSIWFFSGIIIFTLGIVGLYVGKTFEGVKNRPIYIIDKKTWKK